MLSRPRVVSPAIVLVLLALLPIGCAGLGRDAPPPRDGVFVHVRSGPEDAHSALMGLQMAKVMSDDHDVIVYVDIRGIALLLADGPDPSMEPFGSVRGLLGDLATAGVPVMACPTCLEVAGKTPSDLLPGIDVASKGPFFDFTAGRILTIDY